MQKKKLCLSFSMGETSGFMTEWCLQNLSNEYDMVVVCANTGEEDEKSLIFANQCDLHFGWNMVWVECITNPEFGIGATAKVVTFETASRNGEPFEGVIAKYGIPNPAFPHCSRELKEQTIRAYLRDQLEWHYDTYYTAIGIRIDEQGRLDWDKAFTKKLLYPLATHIRMDKPRINNYWDKMPFRLTIKSYQGNCKWCWKKEKRKLMTLAIENPEYFDFPKRMEIKYGDYVPEHRSQCPILPITFFRHNESVQDIFEDSKFPFKKATDQRTKMDVQAYLWGEIELDENSGCSESCEAF